MLRRKNAFTLIELLVVVSIIALLVSIMMPALAAAREQGQRAVCLTQIRGMTIAWTIYADENDSGIIPAKTRRIVENGNFNPPEFIWGTDADQIPHSCPMHADAAAYMPNKTWIGQFIPQPVDPAIDPLGYEASILVGLMFPYVESPDLYICPVVQDESIKYSYSIIDPMNGHDCWSYNNNTYIIYRKISEIESPAERIVFTCEGENAQKYGMSWTPLNLPGNYPNNVSYWDRPSISHASGTTFSFADGHAEYRGWEDPRTIELIESGASQTDVNTIDIVWLARHGWGLSIPVL